MKKSRNMGKCNKVFSPQEFYKSYLIIETKIIVPPVSQDDI